MRSIALAGVLALAACGSSSSGSLVPARPAPTSATAQTPLAYGNITVRFPDDYHVATKAGSSTRRGPTFVDPTATNTIDVWVDDASNPSGTFTLATNVAVVNAGDGTQTINHVPFFASRFDIALVEWDSSHTTVLALGETDPSTATTTTGGTSNVTIQMYMNAVGAAVSLNANGSGGALLPAAVVTANGASLYFYAADGLGGYVASPPANPGSGGLPPVAITTQPGSGNTGHLSQNALGAQTVTCAPGDVFSAYAVVDNPAYDELYASSVFGNTSANAILRNLGLPGIFQPGRQLLTVRC